jgi:hypothetical protein
VHLTLGILRTSQAVFYALSFFWLDGFAVPTPSAGNANRWAVPCKAKGKEQHKIFVNCDMVFFEIEKGNQWQNFTHLGLKYL